MTNVLVLKSMLALSLAGAAVATPLCTFEPKQKRLTDWMMGTDRFWGVEWVESRHEGAANIVTAAAILHVLAAIFESLRHRENLPWAMITGYKRAASGTDIDHAPPAG